MNERGHTLHSTLTSYYAYAHTLIDTICLVERMMKFTFLTDYDKSIIPKSEFECLCELSVSVCVCV